MRHVVRRGRRPGPASSSDDVLDAARRLFAERGYRATTVRAIAAGAGVTPAMVHHFFGSKEQIFLAAIRMPLNPAELMEGLLAGPRAEFPQRLVHTFVGAWRSEVTGPPLRSMLRSAVTDEEHAAALRSFMQAVLLPRAAEGLGVPERNVAAAMSVMIGQAVVASLLEVEPLAAATDDELLAIYAPAVAAALGWSSAAS
jgi:AcrR family transcriptional regulator